MNMQVRNTLLVEHCIAAFDVGRAVSLDDARWLRGAVSNEMRRPEFHNHIGEKLSYSEPLIRYDSSVGKLSVVGIQNGAMLVKSLPRLKSLRLGDRDLVVHDQRLAPSRVEVGPIESPVRYRFASECLPLNQDNYSEWRRVSIEEKNRLLQRILIGNLLSFAKGIGLNVTQRIELHCDLEPTAFRVLKPGVRMLGFTGEFCANFMLPPLWGLGKSTARGFGTIQAMESVE
jgi:hypothetical protein